MTTGQKASVERYLETKQKSRTRQRIDGEKVQCSECGSVSSLEWHHIIPFSEGGEDAPGNLQVLCHPCHVRGHKHLDDFRTAGRWGGLVSAYVREHRMGRKRFCEYMRDLSRQRRKS